MHSFFQMSKYFPNDLSQMFSQGTTATSAFEQSLTRAFYQQSNIPLPNFTDQASVGVNPNTHTRRIS